MKKSWVIFAFVLASVLLLCACGHSQSELNDDEAWAKLADFAGENNVDLASYLSQNGYTLSSNQDYCAVYRGVNGTIVINETGAPTYDIYVGDDNGNTRQFGYPSADRYGENNATYRTTLGDRTTTLPTSVFAEVVRLVERQKGGK